MRRGFRTPLKHLSQSGRFASGNPRYYCGPKGSKRMPMPDLPWDDPAFLLAYSEALGVKQLPRTVRAGSIAEAIAVYKTSDEFTFGLAKGTQYARRPILDAIAEIYGRADVHTLREEHVMIALSNFKGHRRNNRHKVWRHFCRWLHKTHRVKIDPMANVPKTPTQASQGRIPWSGDDIAKFREFWSIGTMERLTFELLFWTGARIGDAVRLGPGNVDAKGWLVYKQQKTKVEVNVPFNRMLPEFAEPLLVDLVQLKTAIKAVERSQMTWVLTKRGTSRSPKAASQWFAAKAREAGLLDRTAHGLRKSRSIALAEALATPAQIGAWTGHESLTEIERYTRKYDRRRVLSRTNSEQKVPTQFQKFQESR